MFWNVLNFYFCFVGFTFFYYYAEIINRFNQFFDENVREFANTKYDYIVVGSGTGGSIVAHGLSKKNYSVLVIEAGNYGTSLFDIPVFMPLIQRTSFDWNYKTVKQKNACLGLKNGESFWPMGKIFGGTHKLNNMIYHRGHVSDYDVLGYDEEHYQDEENFINVEKTRFSTEFSDVFIEAGRGLGLEGFSHINFTQDGGKRVTYSNILKPNQKLKILLNSLVTRVLFDKNNPKLAIGVEIFKNEQFHKIYAKDGVILSAGTIGTPKILMLSGIGPKWHLKKLGVPLLEDLPVGENLQDHVTTGFGLILLNQSLQVTPLDMFFPKSFFNYMTSAESFNPLSFPGADAMGFAALNPLKSDIPDLSFLTIPVSITNDFGLHLKNIVNFNDNLWQNYFKPLIGKHSTNIIPVLLHPKSRGYVRLNSNNFLDPPLINPNYLEHPEDISKLKSGIRIIQKLIESPSVQKFGAEINSKSLPGCEHIDFDSEEYWECYLRHMTFTAYHPVGTCKMGHYDNPETVVLLNYQVKNLQNLFVVDGSILPNLPSANPNAVIAVFAKRFERLLT